MADSRVRIYQGSEGADVLGFSADASGIPDNEAFGNFFSQRGYTIRDLPEEAVPDCSVSGQHVEVRPPLDEDHLKQLGHLLIDIADSGNHSTYVIDNRFIPVTGRDGGRLIASSRVKVPVGTLCVEL